MNQNDDAAISTDFAEGRPPNARKATIAYCPKCGETMNSSLPVCPHCGYDFPLRGLNRIRTTAFSTFADLVLILGAGIAGLGGVGGVVVAVVAMKEGSPGGALVVLMFAILLLALSIVFMRVQRLEPPP